MIKSFRWLVSAIRLSRQILTQKRSLGISLKRLKNIEIVFIFLMIAFSREARASREPKEDSNLV